MSSADNCRQRAGVPVGPVGNGWGARGMRLRQGVALSFRWGLDRLVLGVQHDGDLRR